MARWNALPEVSASETLLRDDELQHAHGSGESVDSCAEGDTRARTSLSASQTVPRGAQAGGEDLMQSHGQNSDGRFSSDFAGSDIREICATTAHDTSRARPDEASWALSSNENSNEKKNERLSIGQWTLRLTTNLP